MGEDKHNIGAGGFHAAPLALELINISKSFGSVAANKNIDLSVKAGSIHGIIGENGAGKSTLMNILYGFYQSDSGEIHINGQKAKINSPADAIQFGIGMVHQHFMLVPRFSVLENVMLGSEGGMLLKEGREKTLSRLQQLADDYQIQVDPHALVSDLNVGTQQRVEILKALKGGAKILILDEPTGVLTPQETDHLFHILRELRNDGVTILLITHKLDEIMAITDHVSIMRRGQMVGHRRTCETNEAELAEMMVGRAVVLDVDKGQSKPADIRLSVRHLCAYANTGHAVIKDLSFDLHAGEILGIAGVSGNGQTELQEILGGMRPPSAGEITVLGHSITPDRPSNPRKLRDIGVCHIPEDRHHHGLILDFEACENMALGYQHTDLVGDGFLLNQQQFHTHCAERMKTFDIRPQNPVLYARNFSGGNQQKIVIARELYQNPKVLIVGQPTRGVDVGAIEFIHKQLIALRDQDCAILLISVELDEVMGLSDRIMVMNAGKNIGIVDATQTNVQKLGLMMAGVA